MIRLLYEDYDGDNDDDGDDDGDNAAVSERFTRASLSAMDCIKIIYTFPQFTLLQTLCIAPFNSQAEKQSDTLDYIQLYSY